MADLAKRVYRAFDPAPLTAESNDLYVELDDVRGNLGLVNNLAKRIRLSEKPTCQIVAGHRGSGKTTELRRLQQELETGPEKVFVVFCETDDDLDRNDVDFPDVLIAIVRQMAQQLREQADIELEPGYFEDRWNRLKDLFTTEIDFTNVTLDAGLLKIASAIKSSPDVRAKIREALEPDTNNWLYAANEVIGEAKTVLKQKGFQGLAVIVDDLDKMVLRPHAAVGCSTGEYLFVHREAQLSDFLCHMVYTMPLALAYSGRERDIANLYGATPPVVPMTQIKKRGGGRHAQGFKRFREIIAKRLKKAKAKEQEIFESNNVRDSLIELSGGQPRELMILVREAIIGGELPISAKAVDRAAHEGRRAYARQIRAEHTPIIDQVRREHAFARAAQSDPLFLDLLDSRAILQYRNDDEWYGVNPLVPENGGPLADA